MKLLAIDTALAACSAAILDISAGAVLGERSVAMVRGHAEALMPMLDDLLAETGLGLVDIERFAVTVGPGTFTGVRVGVAAVRGFALVTGKPASGVSTLAALAETARSASAPPPGGFLVAIDARRGEIYAQSFDAAGDALDEPRVAPAGEVVAALPERVQGVFGTGADLACAAAGETGHSLAVLGRDAAPSAGAVGRAALRPRAALPPSPLYLRPPDAKPQDGAAVARR